MAESDAARRALCDAAGMTDADPSEARPAAGEHPNETAFAKALAGAFATRALAATLAALKQAGVPCMEAQPPDSEHFLDDPHAHANDMVTTRQHPTGGALRIAWNYIRFANTVEPLGRPTPLLGQHTDEVLQEVGYDATAIASLHEAGVIKTETP